MKKQTIAALLAAAVGPVACQMVAGLDGDFTKAPETQEDAGADAAEAGPTGCAHATYPDPPAGASDGPDLPPIVLAARTLELGEALPTPPGYDLDGVCTCFADAGPTCTSKNQHCDAPGGIDSASARFFNLVQFATGAENFSSAALSAKIEAGTFSLIVRVTKYDGKPDDPRVLVAIYPSPGAPVPPAWDGHDAWTIQGTSVSNDDPDQPVYKSDGAYVSNGVLVAALPSIEMTLGSAEDAMTLHLTGGVLTGRLDERAAGWTLTDGIIAARWRIEDVFRGLSTYRDNNGKPICTDATLAYANAKATLCNGLDVLADPSGAKTLPCDALSIGLGFTANEAIIGSVDPPPMPLPGCPPETDPINDKCH